MIKLFINEISGRVYGVQDLTDTIAVTNSSIPVVNSITEFTEFTSDGMRKLVDNLYYRDGKLQIINTRDIDYIDAMYNYESKILMVNKELKDMKGSVLDKLISGVTLDTITEEYNKKKEEFDNLQKSCKALQDAYNLELQDFYNTEDQKILSSLNIKYYSAICLLIRDENEYLKEWIDYYKSLNVSHIYIYDNGKAESVIDITSQYDETYITVIPFTPTDTQTLQQDAYSHFLTSYGSETRWVAFVDSDEFIEIKSIDPDINSFLKNYEDYGSVYMNWVVYNANGQETKTEGSVQERFTQTVVEPICHIYNKSGKHFMQPYKVGSIYRYNPEFIRGNESFINENFNMDLIVLNHYYTKSLEEWTEKINRGSCDSRYLKKYEEFFKLNPDMQSLYKGEIISQRYNL